MSEHQQQGPSKQKRRQPRYTFRDDTVQTARAIMLIARTRTTDAEPLIIDLLEGYAERARWPGNRQEQGGQEPR